MKRQSCHHIETSQLICSANQLTGFCMIANMAFNDLMWLCCLEQIFAHLLAYFSVNLLTSSIN